jgi:DNA-binding IclR family transcriptional regulator
VTERAPGTPPLLVLRKVCQILDCFTVEDPTPTLQQLTRRTGLPSSTCQRLVHNLVREGFLDRGGDRYRIGMALVRWAAPGTVGLDLVRLVRPDPQRLRDETGETACLHVRDGAFRTAVAVAETHHVVMRLFTVGMVMPMHAGAPGTVFLAHDPAARADVLGEGLARFTADTPVEMEVLDRQVEQARADGYCAAFSERHEDVGSISAPVFDQAGELAAVLGIGAPTQRVGPRDVGRLAPVVVAAAAAASSALGFRRRRRRAEPPRRRRRRRTSRTSRHARRGARRCRSGWPLACQRRRLRLRDAGSRPGGGRQRPRRGPCRPGGGTARGLGRSPPRMIGVPEPELPTDGLVAVVKRDCPTCRLVEPVLARLGGEVVVYSQDDPTFPPSVAGVRDDTALDASLAWTIDTVPTLLRLAGGAEVGRAEGWLRPAWEELSGVAGLGADLPEHRPGCGSRTADPELADALLVRTRGGSLRSRRIELTALEDEAEALFDRGWSDGLPVVAPTPARVLRMLAGTSRAPDDVVAVVPPNLVTATVEKVAVNAVLAGCRPEHLPVVLAAVEAACTDEFNAHGLLATTWGAGPAVVVNGAIAREIGMNAGGNALGQGSRANLTIGRALQLVIRNVGGGRPGEVDRAALGHPGKVGFCFAEDEDGSPWEPLSVSRGVAPGASAVTVFAAEGPRGIADQISRTPESLARSLAAGLRGVAHPKLPIAFDATLVVCPEHGRVFAEAGWSRADLEAALGAALLLDPAEIERGAGGIEEGLPAGKATGPVPKFRPGGLMIAYAGGGAGMFSAVIGGWVGGPGGSQPVTREVAPWA